MLRFLGPLMDLFRSRESNDREVFKSMYEKHGGSHVVYDAVNEGLAVRSRERRLLVEKEIRRLHASLGESNDSQ